MFKYVIENFEQHLYNCIDFGGAPFFLLLEIFFYVLQKLVGSISFKFNISKTNWDSFYFFIGYRKSFVYSAWPHSHLIEFEGPKG